MPSSLPSQTCVLVVGAGPTGLLLAGELQRRGVPTLLIDARAEALHWDRATVIHPLSLEIFEALGLADRFLEAGCRQRRILIHADGRRLGELDLAVCGSRYGFNIGLSEEVTEAILTDHLESAGGTVHRACRLVALQPNGDGVTATVTCGEREQSVQTRWVVGCDGLRSTTRELSGIRFDGHAITRPWAVFDAAVEGWADSHEVNAAFLDASPLILTSLPEHRWRVYLRPAGEQGDLVAEASAVLRRYLPAARFSAVENPSRFHCHSRVASSFRAGPVFVAGDAAHVCSPAEGHGMNCGLHDAANLAWKLALVHHGAAAPALLDSYEQERRPVAQQICRSGDATEQAHALKESGERAARDRAIAAMLANPVARQQEVVAETEMNVSYAGSAISGGSDGHPLAAGQRLPTTIALPDGAGARPCCTSSPTGAATRCCCWPTRRHRLRHSPPCRQSWRPTGPPARFHRRWWRPWCPCGCRRRRTWASDPSPCWPCGRTASSPCEPTPTTAARRGVMPRWCWATAVTATA